MTRWGPAVLAAMVVAGCSRESATPDQTAEAPSAPTSAGGEASNLAGRGAGLTGEVSGLSGEISGFAVEETATQTIVELAADVLFAFDRADLTPAATPSLSRTAELIRAGGSGPVAVRGYTDAKGDDAYNLDLSQRRAQAVASWLSGTGGVDGSRLKPQGLGEADPVAPNSGTDGTDNPEGRALNRRVTVVIPKR